MGLFDFFKKNKQTEDEHSQEKYWALTTGEEELREPTWAQIEAAVDNATPEGAMFASLGYFNGGHEIEVVQTVGEDGIYLFEALPPKSSLEYGDIYVKDGLNREETLKLFEVFFDNRRIIGYRDWLVEKNRV